LTASMPRRSLAGRRCAGGRQRWRRLHRHHVKLHRDVGAAGRKRMGGGGVIVHAQASNLFGDKLQFLI
jgi:hypothetical protein